MNRKTVFLLLGFLLMSQAVFAHGAKDVSEIDVENLESWQESFDLTDKSKGKYNILVTATDLGGNVHIEGPHNIFIDPNSDLPVSGITNPAPNMRIVGNLNIVGTCVDDDAVLYVDLILDGDEENPVRASGKEFWSYYLDTTKLDEGPHTIKVIGTDVNGLPGNPVQITWNLDRRQPVTSVNNYGMGDLVSGAVKFSGVVSDGNGIRSLFYSTDNGENFKPISLKDKKEFKEFAITIDTRKFSDGPAVLWFKAIDNAGSEGVYSFLYFIDNTKPEIQIITPEEKDPQYGKVTIAGIAKDILGVTELTWTFGTESGAFELVPGNPYWGITFDTVGSHDTSRKFTITGKDLVGNIITVSRVITLNQLLDKPILKITEPTSETFVEPTDEVFVRGIASDKEGIVSVFYRLDDGEFIQEQTKGAFYGSFGDGSKLTAGSHTIYAYAVDRNGTQSDTYSVSFSARGAAPVFSDAVITGSSGNVPFINGISVHPEAGLSYQTTVTSSVGLESIHYEIQWGTSGSKTQDLACNGAMNYKLSIPFTADMPKGIVKLYIKATDIAGRTKNQKGLVDVVNTSVITTNEPKIVFDDSTVSPEGVVENNADFPVSGYFIGGYARSVEIVPVTPFATAELHGNQIVLLPGKAYGTSEPVVVRVTTDQGIKYDSQKLVFKNDSVNPVIKLNQTVSETQIMDGGAAPIVISGTATCSTGLNNVYYTVYSSKAAMSGTLVNNLDAVQREEPVTLELKRSAFNFEFSAVDRGYGVYFIEITAESKSGNKTSTVIPVKYIPELGAQTSGKPNVAKGPLMAWADGEDIYVAAVSQEALVPLPAETPAVEEGEEPVEVPEAPTEVQDFKIFKRNTLVAGQNPLTFTVNTPAGKLVSSKFTANKDPDIKVNFAFVGEKRYMSGIPVEVASGITSSVLVYIDVEGALSGVDYEITGESVPGGNEKQTGAATFVPSEDTPNRFVATIPLANLPVRMNKIKVTAKVGGVTKSATGTVGVIRPENRANTDDNRALYTIESSDSSYDKDSKMYVLKTGESFYFYSNTPEIVSATLLNPVDGLSIDRNGNTVIVTATKDGTYRWQQVRVRDINGISYTSSEVQFIVDSGAPELVISTPEIHSWQKRTVKITGTAYDAAGIRSGEYSVDGGVTWRNLTISSATKGSLGATFSNTEDISALEDGIIPLDVRVFDTAGNMAYKRTVIHKDTQPPEVEIVMPTEGAIVNGDNLVGFRVYDNGSFEKAYYNAPASAKLSKPRVELEASNFVMAHIGTEEMPIDETMSFDFIDDAGNVTTVESWNFTIDNKSDLPIVEVHLPAENEVVTRDFTISGVVYDDDGPSTIYYRIDRGEYIELEEQGNSFAIDVPFSTMLDNEHTIFVYGVDINGVRGPIVERKFRVSTEEPKGAVVNPTIDVSINGVITVSGVATDRNGIDKVYISLDNGNSYNIAEGKEEWAYTFDTRAIPNGTQVIFLKIFDNYGIQGLYSSLINIDNEAPEMILDYPKDYSITAGPLFFSGYAFDNVNITEMYVTIRSLDGKTVPRSMQKINFQLERIIANTLDLTSLENGFYNIELTALDKAGNQTHLSRNIQLDKTKPLAEVRLLYPLNGEHKSGVFNIYGEATADKDIESVTLYFDGKFVADAQLEKTGFFKFPINDTILDTGLHKYRVDARVRGGNVIRSREQTLDYSANGPWITVDNFNYGNFATNRPFIEGHAGYSLDDDEIAILNSKTSTKEEKEKIASKNVARVEVSFDNGKTFTQVSKGTKWKYRIENEDLPEGYHFMLVRAVMKNGAVAIERCIVQVDNTKPVIRLITPAPGGLYNQELMFSGLSGDDIGLNAVKLALRKGDKGAYELPSFIQGLYLDTSFWGATLFSIGAGLTFFDDAVKLQFQWGQFTQEQRNIFEGTTMRYGGSNIMGIKLIANIAQFPFSYFLGRDFDWLSASIAVGANFTRFDKTASGRPQVLSAVLAQFEFPKVTLKNNKMFSAFSLYTEFSLWFIPTDVESTVDISNLVPSFSEGIRVNVF